MAEKKPTKQELLIENAVLKEKYKTQNRLKRAAEKEKTNISQNLEDLTNDVRQNKEYIQTGFDSINTKIHDNFEDINYKLGAITTSNINPYQPISTSEDSKKKKNGWSTFGKIAAGFGLAALLFGGGTFFAKKYFDNKFAELANNNQAITINIDTDIKNCYDPNDDSSKKDIEDILTPVATPVVTPIVEPIIDGGDDDPIKDSEDISPKSIDSITDFANWAAENGQTGNIRVNAADFYGVSLGTTKINSEITPEKTSILNLNYEGLLNLIEWSEGKEDWQTKDHNITFNAYKTTIRPELGADNPAIDVYALNPLDDIVSTSDDKTSFVCARTYDTESAKIVKRQRALGNYMGVAITADTEENNIDSKVTSVDNSRPQLYSLLTKEDNVVYLTRGPDGTVNISVSNVAPSRYTHEIQGKVTTEYGVMDEFRKLSNTTPKSSSNNGGNPEPVDPWNPDPTNPYNPKDEQETKPSEDGQAVVGDVYETR